MKILLTGNTKGLGKAIEEELSRIVGEYTITGASRSIGLHVNDIDVKVFEDYDVLINNAYHSTGQLDLLKRFYEMWRGKNKTIINVGTAGLKITDRPYETLNYNASKTQLETYSRWISDNDKNCKCMLFSPGYMNTDLVANSIHHYSDDAIEKNTSKSLDVSYCAKIVRLMIESPNTIRDLQLIP